MVLDLLLRSVKDLRFDFQLNCDDLTLHLVELVSTHSCKNNPQSG